MSAGAFVALLRGVNVGGHKKVPMAALRELAEALGWSEPATYVQSGNLVFGASGKAEALAAALGAALQDRFGFEVPVAVRRAADWGKIAAGGAFPDAEAERPKALHVGVTAGSAVTPTAAMVAALAPYCTRGERIATRPGALWVDFADGLAQTKLSPAVLDRVLGKPVTMRNWNTVTALGDMLAAR